MDHLPNPKELLAFWVDRKEFTVKEEENDSTGESSGTSTANTAPYVGPLPGGLIRRTFPVSVDDFIEQYKKKRELVQEHVAPDFWRLIR